jgi:DNA-binding protein YbaB
MDDISAHLQQLAQSAQMAKQQAERAQQELSDLSFEADTGGGAVRATVNGSNELTGLTISPDLLDPTRAEEVTALVLAAVQQAQSGAEQLRQQRLEPLRNILRSMQ